MYIGIPYPTHGDTTQRTRLCCDLLKKDTNLSTLDGLEHLATEIEFQIKLLDVAYYNQDVALKIILEVHKSFLDKHTIRV